MRVTGQIVENVLRSPEGWLGIDHPAFSIERPDEGAKHLLLCHRLQRAGQAELLGAPRPFQAGDELATEHRAENLHRQEEWIARANPLLVIWSQTSGWNHAVNMRVKLQSLTPGVRTLRNPISAPRCLGSAATSAAWRRWPGTADRKESSIVEDQVANWCGRVKTTCT